MLLKSQCLKYLKYLNCPIIIKWLKSSSCKSQEVLCCGCIYNLHVYDSECVSISTHTQSQWNFILYYKQLHWHTYVTLQGIDYELPEDDTVVSKHVGAV
jgi:hypothetical protein